MGCKRERVGTDVQDPWSLRGRTDRIWAWLNPHPSSPAKEKSRSPVPEPVFINKMEPKGGCGLGSRGPPGAPIHLPSCPTSAIYTHHLKWWAEGSPGSPCRPQASTMASSLLSPGVAWPLCYSPSPGVTVAQKTPRGGRAARQGGKQGLPHPCRAPLLLSPINRE